jgi:hypothetical protein
MNPQLPYDSLRALGYQETLQYAETPVRLTPELVTKMLCFRVLTAIIPHEYPSVC